MRTINLNRQRREPLTDEERALIRAYRAACPAHQRAVFDFCQTIARRCSEQHGVSNVVYLLPPK
jgi:hypothetical protein